MIQIIKEINVEVTKPNIFQALVAKQYDMNTRFLKVTLMDCGTRIDVPYIETAKVVINAERKDGQSKGFEGTINEDGTVTVPLHSWMLELDGTVICDISVIDTAADDNKKLTTTSFTLLVEKAAFGGEDITTDPQFDVLVALLEASKTAQEALDKSNEANSKYDACVEATENANAAANELENIKHELAEGGYIESFKEKNNGLHLGFWVGTREEYEALSEKPQDCYVLITDDNFETGTIETESDYNNTVEWYYEKRSDGILKCWANIEYYTNSENTTTHSITNGIKLPFTYTKIPNVQASIINARTCHQAIQDLLVKYTETTSTCKIIATYISVSENVSSVEGTLSIAVVGKWK